MSEEQKAAEVIAENEKDYIGDIVKGKCEEISEKRVFFTFDEKQRVFVNAAECPFNIQLGDTHDIYIDGISKNGFWVGSLEKVSAARLFQQIESAKTNETDLDAVVIAAENNGLVCDVLSLMAFMPKREIEESPMAELDSYIGKKLSVRVIKFSASDGNLIVSHRAAIAQQLREEREKLLAQLKPEQIYPGRVKQIVDFGVFVDIGAGVEGLVHRSNLSWDNSDPASIVSIGDKLNVKVLAMEQGRISLGHKQLIPDTWSETIKDLHVGDIVEAKITTFANFGAFARVENKVEGLIHNSELSWNTDVKQPRQILKLGECVQVKIIGIDEERRRLKLSLRQLTDNPWKLAAEKYAVDSVWKLPIVGIADFGLFVDLGNNIRGLIHKSDIQWSGNVSDLELNYHVGDEVECKVLSIDVEKERASLGIKQLTRDPWRDFVDKKPLGHQFEAEIKRIVKFGAFAAIGEVEGLIHISEMSEDRVENIGSILKVGQNVTVTVISIDEDKRRIGLSLIADPFEPEEELSSQNDSESSEQAKLGDIIPDELKG